MSKHFEEMKPHRNMTSRVHSGAMRMMKDMMPAGSQMLMSEKEMSKTMKNNRKKKKYV